MKQDLAARAKVLKGLQFPFVDHKLLIVLINQSVRACELGKI